MPIQPKLIGSNTTEYKYVHSKENEFLCKRVTYQEYKMDYDITSDEYDDLDIGYEITYTFGVYLFLKLWLLICLIFEINARCCTLPHLVPYWGFLSSTKYY